MTAIAGPGAPGGLTSGPREARIVVSVLPFAHRAYTVGSLATESRYRRFFAPKRGFSDKEIDFYLNVDFENHVALVAVVDVDGAPRIVGGARYIATTPGRAEIAFAVDDRWQGQGIASALLRHVVSIARARGLAALDAEVLSENTAMLKVFERAGVAASTRRAGGVVHVALDLAGTIRQE